MKLTFAEQGDSWVENILTGNERIRPNRKKIAADLINMAQHGCFHAVDVT